MPYQDEPWISAFEGAALRARARDLKSEKLGVALRREIAAAQDKLALAQEELDTARNNAERACEQFLETNDRFQREIVALRSTSASAPAREVSDAADEIKSILECWSYGSDARRELSAIEDRITRLSARARDLGSSDSADRVKSAAEKLRAAFGALQSKRNDVQAARDAYSEVAKVVAALMYKAATASGQKDPDRSALKSAVEALPKIEMISQQLDLITHHVDAIENKLIVSRANAVCRTTSAIATNGSVTTESAQSLVKQQELWKSRKTSVYDTVSRALAVPGAE